MSRFVNKLLGVVVIILVVAAAFATVSAFNDTEVREKSDEIAIVYTNDVHCAINDNIGYVGLSAFRNEMLSTHNYVLTVDYGDFIQGNIIGAVTKGIDVTNLTNCAGYDIAALGNHEFDFGIDALKDVMSEADFDILSCNIDYIGPGDNPLEDLGTYEARFKVDTSFPSNVVYDDTGNFISVDGKRHVSDVMVLDKDTGEYMPIEPDRTYYIATNSFIAGKGNGYSMFDKDEIMKDYGILDVSALIEYVTANQDVIDEMYAELDGRIVRI